MLPKSYILDIKEMGLEWGLSLDQVNVLIDFVETVYDDAYSDGYHEVTDAAYHDGKEDGYETGYDMGRDDGYNQGYDDGLRESQ